MLNAIMKFWRRFWATEPRDYLKEGDETFCYQCGKECICGSACPHCGFPAPGPDEFIIKGF